MEKSSLILASISPRREFILRMLGFDFSLINPDFEENFDSDLPFKEVPEFLAKGKALSIQAKASEDIVLSADTLVFLEGKILSKPKDHDEALHMLQSLNGQTHSVITGVAIAQAGKIMASGHTETLVSFVQSSALDLQTYARSSEPMDKAGSYAIQGRGACLVKKIEGCFYNVMGLPVQLTLDLLKPFIRPIF